MLKLTNGAEPRDRARREGEMYPFPVRAIAWIRLNIYMPLFHPLLWWRYRQAEEELLEMIGWIDINW